MFSTKFKKKTMGTSQTIKLNLTMKRSNNIYMSRNMHLPEALRNQLNSIVDS